jgi:hypothetical protein
MANRFTWTYGASEGRTVFINDNDLLDPKGHNGIAGIACHRIGNEEAERLAKLWIAAPEMYEKLDDLRTMLDEAITYLDLADVDILIFKQTVKDIESLLAKAEGKEDSHG